MRTSTRVETALTALLKNVFREPPLGRYLCFGQQSKFVADWAAGEHWKGTLVTSEVPDTPIPEGRVHVVGHVGPDPQIKMLMEGHYTRMITVSEMFNQFPGPYDLVVILGTGRDREIYYTKNIMDVIPKVYVITEDGHNKALIKEAVDRAYYSECVGEQFLMLVHQ